eukprot:1142910-Pelagomonas_calceolata.AAC.2
MKTPPHEIRKRGHIGSGAVSPPWWPRRRSYASGSHLKLNIKEGPTPTATRARTRNPPPPGRGRVFDSASHFNPPATYPPKWASSGKLQNRRC